MTEQQNPISKKFQDALAQEVRVKKEIQESIKSLAGIAGDFKRSIVVKEEGKGLLGQALQKMVTEIIFIEKTAEVVANKRLNALTLSAVEPYAKGIASTVKDNNLITTSQYLGYAKNAENAAAQGVADQLEQAVNDLNKSLTKTGRELKKEKIQETALGLITMAGLLASHGGIAVPEIVHAVAEGADGFMTGKGAREVFTKTLKVAGKKATEASAALDTAHRGVIEIMLSIYQIPVSLVRRNPTPVSRPDAEAMFKADIKTWVDEVKAEDLKIYPAYVKHYKVE